MLKAYPEPKLVNYLYAGYRGDLTIFLCMCFCECQTRSKIVCIDCFSELNLVAAQKDRLSVQQQRGGKGGWQEELYPYSKDVYRHDVHRSARFILELWVKGKRNRCGLCSHSRDSRLFGYLAKKHCQQLVANGW